MSSTAADTIADAVVPEKRSPGTDALNTVPASRHEQADNLNSRPCTRELREVGAPTLAMEPAVARGRGCFTSARLEAFVAIAEEAGISAAARRLHTSQPALSQSVNVLERHLGVKLLVRSGRGVRTTPAGQVLLEEARATLARHDQLIRAMVEYAAPGGSVIRLGIPPDLAPDVLCAVSNFIGDHPETRVEPVNLPMAEQLTALRGGRLDVSFMHERPSKAEFDALLVGRENLGVLLADNIARQVAGPDGIPLESLAGLNWVGFPRPNSPAWYDELAAMLRTHGIDAGGVDSGGDHPPNPSVIVTAASSGHAFALAPALFAYPVPPQVVWKPLADHPVVQRTWAVWPARSRRRHVAKLIAAFEPPPRFREPPADNG
jgi:DNA-binding transcriptional LysR family regulator